MSYSFAYGYPPHLLHLVEGPEPKYLLPVGHVEALAPLFDTVVFNVGLHHLSLEDAAVTEYRAAVTNLMTIAQKHSHGYLLETISQHFCEEDGSYEQTALATKGKPLTARTNRNMECKGPYSVEAWRKTANWRCVQI